MKDKPFSHSASPLMNRNWVLKRKRRKIPGPSFVNDTSASSAKGTNTTDLPSHTSSSKKKGNDGYYYECVICDIGGNLLCCDSCPRTYHLQCLDPPLKRIPTGKWQCQKCCSQRTNPVKQMSNLDPISKRARSKLTNKKIPSGLRPSGPDKVTHMFGGSVLARRRSSRVGNSESRQSDPYEKLNSSPLDSNSTIQHNLATPGYSSLCHVSCMNALDKRIANISPFTPSAEMTLINPEDQVEPHSRYTHLEQNAEMPAEKRELSENNDPQRNEVVLAIGVAEEIDRKRKPKANHKARGKKHRTDKGKHSSTAAKNHASKSKKATHEASGTQPKLTIVDQRVSTSSKECGRSNSAQLKEEDLPRETLQPLIYSSRNSVESFPACEASRLAEHQQVDRVLGCRVQVDDASSFCRISVARLDQMQSDELVIPKNQNRQSEENYTSDNGLAVAAENLVESPNVNRSEKDEGLKHDVKTGNLRVYQRSLARELQEANSTHTLTKDSNKLHSAVIDDENQDGFAVTMDIYSRRHEKVMIDEADGGIDLKCKKIAKVPTEKLGEVDKESEMNGKARNKGEKIALVESRCSEGVKTCYEFLVKWVGKSHIHNSWIPETQLKVLAKRKFENYKAKYGTAMLNICEEKWKQPQRVISLRDSVDGSREVLVKWTGLPYDECTWERLDEPVIQNCSHLINLFGQLECQTLEKNAEMGGDMRKEARMQTEIVTLSEQPSKLKGGSLFPHQLEALNWLRKCWNKSKNVILADEMGLGKTVSAIAFISSLYFEFKVNLPSLVLVPLSTMPNWLAEFTLWAPDLYVVDYHGCAKARATIRQYEWHAYDPDVSNKRTASYKFNVLLTTYEMVLADPSHLRGVPWEVLVVDEGHRLKNSGSKLFSLLNTFSFQHRVLLTGTPLQNNIGEMFNLLNFLQPTSFPSLLSFEEKFNDLTTAQKVEELKKLVAPHMLRRLKRDAMQNIPPKTERMVPVELSSIQAEYYRAMLTKNYQILRNIGKGVAQQSMLNIVMQLRKVCNHPYLIPGTEPESGSVEFLHEMRIKASAKLTLLHSMLKQLHREGHRVLIFSQMTKLLDILEDYLTIEFGPKTYERVDGSVSVGDRQTAIVRFNQDKSRFVFLLSTRSCGLGINLATADTVIIYDSDFNPHADIQAMNRAHRIGQSNRLLVYRLVVRASVEERILQLAKKKLVLDQLFVNKSSSQKEVEDILRWGTEELFRDSPNMNRTETGESNNSREDMLMDVEQKQRKRGGGLGDVYKDKCTDAGNKIVWDESAVLKLLDRSNLQSSINDVAEGEIENDMLGAVKSLEWNDEITDEQREGDLPSVFADDISAQGSEKKEDAPANCAEENEWDQLLRIRWEKYQIEEEAALGRGKRQRRAVSYREAYTLHPSEIMIEKNGGEDEREPETEPEREYTFAGRAFKVKYGRLRARQKERLAKRNTTEESHPSEGVSQLGSPLHQCHSTNKDEDQASQSVQLDKEKSLVMDVENDKVAKPSDALKSNNETLTSLGKLSKRKMSKLNLHANPLCQQSDMSFPNNDCEGTSCGNLLPPNNLLPVLGLSAPNANQFDPCYRNFAQSNCKPCRPGTGPDFPFCLDPSSQHAIQTESLSQENVEKFRLPDVSQVLCRSNNTDIRFLFHPYPFPISRENFADMVESSGSTFADFQEKMPLPKLPFDEKLLPKFPLPAKSMPASGRDLFPNLSLGSRHDALKNSMQDLPTMPLLPILKFPPEAPRSQQPEKETPSPASLSLGQMPSNVTSFPENHRRLLESIMMRTGSGLSNLCKKRHKVESWSEDELDCLWVGVRRYGRGNWDAMLRDPRLTLSKYRTSAELAVRWEEEQLKLLNGLSVQEPKSTKSAKTIKSSLFPLVPDGMMTRALQGSRLIAGPKFHSHLTDMKLGFGDPATGLVHLEPPEQLRVQNESFPPISMWNPDNSFGPSSLGPMDRPGTSADAPKEKKIMLNSSGATKGLNHGSCEFSRKEDGYDAMKYGKLPTLLDKSLHSLLNFHNSVGSCDFDPNKEPDLSLEKGKEIVESSLSEDKLPHWLREAVRAPAKTVDPSLPPTVLAIAQSVRVLYGEDKPAIPPFEVFGPPPPRPKDPRLHIRKKKKRKSHIFRHVRTDVTGSSYSQNNLPSVDSQFAPQLALLPLSISGTQEFNMTCSNTNMPPRNLHSNMMTSASAAYLIPPNEANTRLSPFPAVLKLVASSVAQGPGTQLASGSGLASPNAPGELSLARYDDRAPVPMPQVAMEKAEAKQSQAFEMEGKDESMRQGEPDSQDPSKKSTEPCQAEQPDVDEMSSEGTVSDHPPTPSERKHSPASDHEA